MAESRKPIMARQVHERENLLRDAKALVERIELEIVLENCPVTLFAGFRSQGFLYRWRRQ